MDVFMFKNQRRIVAGGRFGRIAVTLAAMMLAGMPAMVPGQAGAHSASGQSLILINGKHTEENPVAKATTETTEDVAAETYEINKPVTFQADEVSFGQTAEFRWVWSEGSGQHDDGPAATHTFTKPGTYNVELQARFGTNTSYTEAGSVAVNVLPTAAYRLPRATVEVTPQTLIEGFRIKFEAAAIPDGTAKIASYAWEFGDGATGEGQSVEHIYKSRDFAAMPYLRVTDSNGLVNEVAFNLHNQGEAVLVSELEGLPGVASLSSQANMMAWWTLGVVLMGLALVTAGAYWHRKRKRRRRHA
jgi:hypothetical protein